MKTILSFIIVCFSCIANAQQMVTPTNSSNNNIMIDLNGSPIKLKGKLEIEGSVYFRPDYCEAAFYSVDGKVYKGVSSRLNLQTNMISFRRSDQEDTEYTPAFKVKKIVFSDCGDGNVAAEFQSGFPSIGVQNENSFYQVLDSGKIMLLKYNQIVETSNPVNGVVASGGTITVQKLETYYVYSSGKPLIRISRSDSDVLKTLADKRKQLDTYLSSNHIRIKKEEDLIKVVQYYNTLD